VKIQANSLQAAGNAAQCRAELALSLNPNTPSFSSANIHLFTWGQESQKEGYLQSSRRGKKRQKNQNKQKQSGGGHVGFPVVTTDGLVPGESSTP